MFGEELSINFEIPARDPLGREHVEGKLRCLETAVSLQFKIRDRTFHRSEPKEIEFSYGDIANFEYTGGWFAPKRLVLSTSDAEILHQLPGAEMGKVELFVSKDSRKDARKAAKLVEFQRSQSWVEKRQDRLEAAGWKADES